MKFFENKRLRKKLGLRRIFCPYPLFWFKTLSKKNEFSYLHSLCFELDPRDKKLLKRLAYYIKWPLCCFTQSFEHIFLKRQLIRKELKQSIIKVWMQSFYYALFYNVPLHLYYSYNLWEPGRQKDLKNYLHNFQMYYLFSLLYKDEDTSHINDKNKFHEKCLEYKLPTTSPIAKFTEGKCEFFVDKVPHVSLFSKNSNLGQGKECQHWKYRESTKEWFNKERSFSEEELINYLRKESLKADLVLQKFEELHPDLKKFSNGALNTLRVTTNKLPGEKTEVLFSSFRIPFGDAVVDNVSVSGLASRVNRNGIMEDARGRNFSLQNIKFHPDTGAKISGEKLPFYDEMVDLAIHAHDCVETPVSLGWDITCTTEGLKIIEANTHWGLEDFQFGSRTPLINLSFIDFVKKIEEKKLYPKHFV